MGKMGQNAFLTLGQFKKILNFKNIFFDPQMVGLTPRNVLGPLTIFSSFIKITANCKKLKKSPDWMYSKMVGFWAHCAAWAILL